MYGPYSWLSRGKSRKAIWGSYAKLRVMEGRVDLSHATGVTSSIAALAPKSSHKTLAWKTPSPEIWTLDTGYPRGVHDDVDHGCEPGLSTTLPCRRLPIVPRYMFLLLSKKTHNHVTGEVLRRLPGIVFRPVAEPAHLSSVGVTCLA